MSVSGTRADTAEGWRRGQCRDRAPAAGRGPGEILLEVEHQGQPSWEHPAHPRADTGAQTPVPVCKCLDTGLVFLLKRWREPLWWMTVNWMKKLNSFLFLPIFFWSIILTSIFSIYHLREPLIGIETGKTIILFFKWFIHFIHWPVFDSVRPILIFENVPLERNKIDLTEMSDDFY